MFGLGKLKLIAPDKSKTDDTALIDDYTATEAIGRAKAGQHAFYYKDLGKKYYVPYDYIERAFVRVSECHPDDSPAYYYYRLILVHDGKEFANLIFNEEQQADSLLAILKQKNPSMQLGYVPPADGKRKPSFM